MANRIVKAAVKERLDQMNISVNLCDALDGKVSDLLADAAQRAEDNNWKTVQPRDL